MIRDMGMVRPGTTIYVPFHAFDSNDPSASVTITGLATTDIEVYDGTMTQRGSDSGYALLDTDGIDIDTITGIHGVSINLADNSTAGFYAAGKQYWVVVASITIDAATINFIPVMFRIGYPDAVINTTIATLASQTSFTLTDGPAEDDALNGCVVCIHDVASAVQLGFAVVSDYTGSTKTVTLTAGVTFTAAATDNISIYPPANTRWLGGTAQTANDVGQDVNDILADTNDIQTRLPSALGANGNMKADVSDWLGTAAATPTVAGVPEVDVTYINGGLTSGNNATLSLKAISVINDAGTAITANSTGGNGSGLSVEANGSGYGFRLSGGSGGTAGFLVEVGGSSPAFLINQTGTGDGLKVTTTSGHGVNLAPVGTNKHGILVTGGNGGTSDGINAVAGTGGVPIRGDITGNITGNLSGSAGSVTGAVGSVTGLTASNEIGRASCRERV